MAIFSDYISLKKAADISGYHSDYIGALIRSGQIHGKKIGNRWMVSESQVKIHFSKKHYAPAHRVFLSRKSIIFATLFVLVLVGYSAFLMETKMAVEAAKDTASTADVQTSLGDIVNLSNATNTESTKTPDGQVIIPQP